jgi:hypothetical protein
MPASAGMTLKNISVVDVISISQVVIPAKAGIQKIPNAPGQTSYRAG